MRHRLPRLLLSLLLAATIPAAACSSDSFSYDAPSGMVVHARFADEAGDVLFFVQPGDSGPGGYVERRSALGETESRTSTDGYRTPRWERHLTVDAGRLLLRRIGSNPSAFEALPSGEPSGPLAVAVGAWLVSVRGLYRDGQDSGVLRTSARSGLSCAIGADRSFAVWDVSNPSSFRASPEGTIPSAFQEFVDLFCLEADGELFVAVHGIDVDRPVGQRSRVLVFNTVGDVVHAVEDINDYKGRPNLTNFSTVGNGLVAIVLNDEFLARDAVRVLRRDGVWITERARVEVPWALRETIFVHLDEIWVGDRTRNVVRRVPWPDGAEVISDGQEIVVVADTQMKRRALAAGTVAVSGNGRYLLWAVYQPDRFVIEAVTAPIQ